MSTSHLTESMFKYNRACLVVVELQRPTHGAAGGQLAVLPQAVEHGAVLAHVEPLHLLEVVLLVLGADAPEEVDVVVGVELRHLLRCRRGKRQTPFRSGKLPRSGDPLLLPWRSGRKPNQQRMRLGHWPRKSECVWGKAESLFGSLEHVHVSQNRRRIATLPHHSHSDF